MPDSISAVRLRFAIAYYGDRSIHLHRCLFLLETGLRQILGGEVPTDKRSLAGFFGGLYHALGQLVEVDERGLGKLELFAARVFCVSQQDPAFFAHGL